MDESLFKVPKTLLKLVGFWPVEFKSNLLARIYKIHSTISLTITLLFIFLQCMEVPNMIQKGLVKLVGLVAVNTQFTIGMIKFFVMRGKRAQKLVKTIEATERSIFNEKGEGGKALYLYYVRQNRKINTIWVTMGAICDVVFSQAPFLLELKHKLMNQEFSDVVIDGYKERPLPLDSWVPFNKFKYYKTTYAWNIIGGVYNTIFIVAVDAVFFSFIVFGISQLTMLRKEIKITINTFGKTNATRNLRNDIIYHQNIIRYIQELDGVMKEFLLLGVGIYILQTALISFQIVVEEPSFEMAKNTYYLLAMIIEVIIFYCLGNEVYLGSTELINSVMNSNWYQCDNSTKKTLLFIMMRANKPLTFSVGPFYYMSTETLLMILKSSVSYSTALRTIYARNNELILKG